MLFFFFFFVRPHLPFDLNQKQTTKKPTDPPPLPKRLPSFYLSLTSTFEILCMEKCGNGMMNVVTVVEIGRTQNQRRLSKWVSLYLLLLLLPPVDSLYYGNGSSL